MLTSVLLLYITIDGDIVTVLRYYGVANETGEVLHFLAIGIEVEDVLDILFRQFVLIAFVDELVRSIDEENLIVRLVLANDDDTGSDADAEEEVSRQLETILSLE